MSRGPTKGTKVINSFVNKSSHKGRHPGFAVNTFPARGARKLGRRGKRY